MPAASAAAARTSFKAALQWSRKLPKAELHLHLDGSLRPEFVARRAQELGIEMPCPPHELGHRMRSRSRESMKLSLSVFDWLNQFLQTTEDLYEATTSLLEDAAADNVVYTEIRFCPTLHCERGLTALEAVEAVQRGVEDSQHWGNVIVCALRSLPPAHSLDMALLARDTGVCGFDIAGDEQKFPLSLHAEALDACRRHSVPMTLHAGEWPGSLDNVRVAVDAGVRRIGHGVALALDEELQTRVLDAGIAIECCPTANVGGAKVASYDEHPLVGFAAKGLRAVVSSDNYLVSGSADTGPAFASGELAHAVADCGMGTAAVLQLVHNAADAAFIPEHDRPKLKAMLAPQAYRPQAYCSHHV